MHIGVVIVNDFHRFGNSWQKNLTVSEIHFSNMIIKEASAVSISTRILKYRVWKIKFDELEFLSSLN